MKTIIEKCDRLRGVIVLGTMLALAAAPGVPTAFCAAGEPVDDASLGPELIADGSFEKCGDGMPAGWTGAADVASVSKEIAADGQRSLQVAGTKDNAAASTPLIAADASSKYLLCFSLKLERTEGSFNVQFATFDKDKKAIKENYQFPANLSYLQPVPQFAKVRHVLVPKLAGDQVAFVRADFKWFGKPSGTAHVDAVSLRKIEKESDATRAMEKAYGLMAGFDYVRTKDDWFPFVFPYAKESPKNAANASFLLDAPAGKRGHVISKDGHLYFEDGTRARFIGGNCGWGSWRPPHDQAEKISDYLARNGLNLVRFYLDGFRFADDQWDLFDYFLHCLKQKGIYVYFYLPPGYPQTATPASIKGMSDIVPREIEAQKDCWKRFLTHVNPYTKLPLAEDPMLAFIFLNNETGIFHYVRRAEHVKGENLQVLQKMWNEWLLKTYKSREELAKAWEAAGAEPLVADEDPAKGTVPVELAGGRKGRCWDYMRFIDEAQRKFYSDMIAHLRSIGVKCPVSGMNRPNTYHDWRAGAETGNFLGDHYYWSHWIGDDVNQTENLAMVRDVTPFSGLHEERGNRVFVGAACRGKVKGVPFGVGEWSTASSANDYRAECQLIMACYAALHDWDFLCHFPLVHEFTSWDDVAQTRKTWNNLFDPARVGLFPTMSTIFLRHDVETAKKVVECVEPEAPYAQALKENTWAYLRLIAGIAPYKKLRPYYAYFSRVENVFEADPKSRADATISNEAPPEDKFRALVAAGIHGPDVRETLRFVSDTNQLTSDVKRGLFSVNAPRVQGAVGFLDEIGRVDLGDLAIDKCSSFAAVVVSALDDRPIAKSARMLLTVVGDADNTDEKRKIVANYTDSFVEAVSKPQAGGKRFRPAMYIDKGKWGRVVGKGPVLVEPIDVEIALKGKDGGAPKVFALSPDGTRGEELEVKGADAGFTFKPSGKRYKTIWYEIVRGAQP